MVSIQLSTAEKQRLVEPLVIRGRSPDSRAEYGFDYGSVRYHGVFRHRGAWRAQIKWFGRQLKIAYRTSALDAAVELALWYEARLGTRWGEWVVSKGKLYPDRDLPWQVRWSKSRKGYVLAVWVAGEREEVVRLKRVRRDVRVKTPEGFKVVSRRVWEKTEELDVFRSKNRTVEYLFVWLVRLYGASAPLLLWKRAERPKTAVECSKFPPRQA